MEFTASEFAGALAELHVQGAFERVDGYIICLREEVDNDWIDYIDYDGLGFSLRAKMSVEAMACTNRFLKNLKRK
jgi:hypothetical protein